MATHKSEFWLTTAVTDNGIKSAIVFAESVRRTRTTRSIGVIATRSMPISSRVALRKAFDVVFYTEEMSDCVADMNDAAMDKDPILQEANARFFAFSLHFTKRVVFVGSNSILLENADKLFETNMDFQCLRNADGSADLSLFMVKPTKGIWESLCLVRSASKLTNDLKTDEFLIEWFSNQREILVVGSIEGDNMAKLSMKDGILLTEKTHAPIIRFIDLSDSSIEEQSGILMNNLGRREKTIVDDWLELYNENARPLLTDPVNIRIDSTEGQVFDNEPVAIIGMSCRYPKANSVKEFWNLLYNGEEGIAEPPAFRWTKEHSIRVSQTDRKTNAGFLSTTVDEFDSRFFGVSPKEAAYMDPQARLLHEVMWEALEDSGVDPFSLHGTHTGIFTGSWMNDYKDIVASSAEQDFFRTYMGNSMGATAARLSFLLGTTGPSIATESGCSSAIVALDLAVKSVRAGESNLALAGGVNLLLHPFTSNIMNYVIAPNGRCKTFDAKADGFGRAEGCGVLVLKRLSDALRDRDNIWAIITGSAVSQEGLSRSLGTPTVHCEALAMQLALADANTKPEQVAFVETHGTGTVVGDPMEVAAIKKAYFSPSRKSPLVIGSVKTNVGHTESCSGITGIMKTVLAMQHELIPKHRNFESLNPEIFLDLIPAVIPLEPHPWPKVKGQPRIAGVSSFGITGTDGHVIVQEAPDYEMPKFDLGMERPLHILKLSAKTSDALDTMIEKYENQFSELAQSKDVDFGDAAYSANAGRASFNHRAFILADSNSTAEKLLQEKRYLQGEVKEGESRQICFLFTGQGSQYHGMAKTLYETSPVFRVNFDVCDRTLQKQYNLYLRDVLWDCDPASKEISRTIYSQTSIFCVEYCLLKLWQSWGIKPDYVLGHSLGEFAAAVAAGIIEFKDALKLVAERSRLIDELPRGSMLVVKASKPEVEKLLTAANLDLDMAAVNNPAQTVVAGDTNKVEEFHGYLKGKGHKAIILDAIHAFHSRHMDPMLEKYRTVARTINYKKSNVQYVSGMEGRVILDTSEINADYWVRHTREKVSFVDACASLRESGCTDFLEIGPQPILSSFVLMNNDDMVLNCFPSLRRGTNDWETILNTLGRLYLLGYKVDWKGYDALYKRKNVSLPFHPFNRKSFWVESLGPSASSIHPLLGYPMNNATTTNIFQNDVTLRSLPYLKDHCIGSRVVFPGAGFVEMSLTAGYCVSNGLNNKLELPRRPIQLENLRIEAPLEVKEDKPCRIQVVVELQSSESESPGYKVKVFHQNNSLEDSGKWIVHATSTYNPAVATKEIMTKWNPDEIQDIIHNGKPETTEEFYKRVEDSGFKFGETFRSICRVWRKPDLTQTMIDKVVAEVKLPSDSSRYLLHPVIIDAVFQTGILTKTSYEKSKLKVPVRIGQLTLLGRLEMEDAPEKILIHAWFENNQYKVFISTQDYTPIAFVSDIELLDTNVRTIEAVLEQQSSEVADMWEEAWKVIPSPFTTRVNHVPPLESLSEESLRALEAWATPSADYMQCYWKTRKVILKYIINALLELGWEPQVGDHLEVETFCERLKILPQFHKLLRFYFTVLEQDGSLLEKQADQEEWIVKSVFPQDKTNLLEMKALDKELQSSGGNKCAITLRNVADNLTKILKGNESALSILFPTGESNELHSAEHFYFKHPARALGTIAMSRVSKSIFEASRKRSSSEKIYRILEVGSGTGSISEAVLAWTKEVCGDNFEYFYTDISASFFLKAEKRLEEYKDNLKFAVFNIEESPLSQSIPVDYFDVVLATDVLHATRNLEECLTNLRETLRVGGSICFEETVGESRDITFVFGTLDGYWRYEDFEYRPHHTCVNPDTWEIVMKKVGYTGCTSFPFGQEFAVMVAEKSSTQVLPTTWKRPGLNRKWVIFGNPAAFDRLVPLSQKLESHGYTVILVQDKNCTDTSNYKGSNLFSIQGNSENPKEINEILASNNGNILEGVLYAWGLDESDTDQTTVSLPFLTIAKAITSMSKPPMVYIVTRGLRDLRDDRFTTNPTAATLLGMAKSFKNEIWNTVVRCVDLDIYSSPEMDTEQLLYEMSMCKGTKEQHRLQVAYRDRIRYEPRFTKATSLGNELQLPPSTDRYKLLLPETKAVQDLVFDVSEPEVMTEMDVEVKVKAYSLNFKDILSILKPTEEFEKLNTIGLDFAGVVTKAGGKSGFEIGEQVFGANFKETQLPSHLVVPAESVLRIPKKLSFSESATLPAVFATAYHCLISVAKMKRGETVLIHTGSGGVGLAAIQIAKHVGAKIITTAGSSRKKAYLRSLGIVNVFHSRDTSFEQDILRVTNGRGVDVVLNSITGSGIKEATLNCCSDGARFVEMSKLSIWKPEEVEVLRPDVIYSIQDLTTLGRDSWKQLLDRMKELLEADVVTPIPYVKFDALHIRQALQFFQKAKHIGKVICVMPEITRHLGKYEVKVPLFNGESTYLVTGGLGGIGFEVCKWMLQHGATDIVLTGRNAPKPAISAELKRLVESGYNIAVRLGDVSDFDQCKAVVEQIAQEMKPLRGVMHCAGVLADDVFSNQTWSAFQATFAPKILGSWNLHNVTKDILLEHFIMYSSLAALIGTPGQPNHSAANCFEDAFIHYRHSIGLPGTTINWGQWSQVGVAKDTNVTGITPVCIGRMLKGLECALRAQKTQVCIAEFDSFKSTSILCPQFAYYIDERLRNMEIKDSCTASSGPKSDDFWNELDAKESKADKMQVVGTYLKCILRQALRLDQEEKIGDDVNLQDIGVDSLMTIELKNRIQALLGNRVAITATEMQNSTTVGMISEVIVMKVMEDVGIDDVISCEPLPNESLKALVTQDAVLPDDILATQLAPVPSQISCVLVTGATGKLAPYIISQLTQNYPSIDRIICLVRNVSDSGSAMAKVKANLELYNLWSTGMNKLECVAGNLSLAKLGMSGDKYKELSEQVHAVIHCGASSNYQEHYNQFPEGKLNNARSINVLGTRNILRFACSSTTKHVYFASNFPCGLFGEDEPTFLPDTWPSNSVLEWIAREQLPAIQASKMICEVLLKQAVEKGIPCKVFRFPWIAGESSTGQVNPINNLYILRYLSFIKLKAMPTLPLPANVLPVDICASLSLKLFFNDAAPKEIYNIGHPHPPVEQEFITIAKDLFNIDLELLEWLEFTHIISNSDDNNVKELGQGQESLNQYFSQATGMVKGYFISPETFFTNTKLSRLLPNYQHEIPLATEVLKRDLAFLKQSGALVKYGI